MSLYCDLFYFILVRFNQKKVLFLFKKYFRPKNNDIEMKVMQNTEFSGKIFNFSLKILSGTCLQGHFFIHKTHFPSENVSSFTIQEQIWNNNEIIVHGWQKIMENITSGYGHHKWWPEPRVLFFNIFGQLCTINIHKEAVKWPQLKNIDFLKIFIFHVILDNIITCDNIGKYYHMW